MEIMGKCMAASSRLGRGRLVQEAREASPHEAPESWLMMVVVVERGPGCYVTLRMMVVASIILISQQPRWALRAYRHIMIVYPHAVRAVDVASHDVGRGSSVVDWRWGQVPLVLEL